MQRLKRVRPLEVWDPKTFFRIQYSCIIINHLSSEDEKQPYAHLNRQPHRLMTIETVASNEKMFVFPVKCVVFY